MTRSDWQRLSVTERHGILREAVIEGGCETLCDPQSPRYGLAAAGTASRCEGCDCYVEPDGQCSHGCPSILIACGLI